MQDTETTGFVRTPSQHERVIEHTIDLENQQYQNTWKSCCLTVDRRAIVYFSQIIIIAFALIFCAYQLMTLKGCTDQQAYMGLFTMLIGILIPNPQIQRRPF